MVFEGDPRIGHNKIDKVTANGGPYQVAECHAPIKLLMLEKDFESNNKEYTCKHGDAHGPVIAGLTICI